MESSAERHVEGTIEDGDFGNKGAGVQGHNDDPSTQSTTSADCGEPMEHKFETFERPPSENLERQLTAASHVSISTSRQTAVMILITLTQLCQMYPYGSGIGTSLSIANSLHDHHQHSTQVVDPSARSRIAAAGGWIAASYPLGNSTFVLIGGRLGEVYGHKFLLAVGCIWWVVWQLASGFAPNLIVLCLFRGLSGAGGGLMVPNAVALIGITIPPGRLRNLAFGMFGAMAPVGAAGGALVADCIVQMADWKWTFFFATMLGAVLFPLVLLLLPSDTAVDPEGEIDWVGAYLGLGGLILFNFVWNQAPAVGWNTPYIYALLIVSFLHIGCFVVWEMKYARSPILPFDIWQAPSFGTLLLMVFFSFMAMGIFLWYTTLFCLTIRGYSLIEAGAYFQPLCIVGTGAAFLSAWLVPRVPAQYIIAIGNTALVISCTLLATAPEHQRYWPALFPALIISSFAVDFIFAAAQVIASNSVSRKRQGVAGSLIGTLLTYGLSTGLGFAGTVEAYTNDAGHDTLSGYRHAFYLAIGLAGLGLIGSLLFLRVPKSDQEGWGGRKRSEERKNIPER